MFQRAADLTSRKDVLQVCEFLNISRSFLPPQKSMYNIY
jgi:hypothetical protein